MSAVSTPTPGPGAAPHRRPAGRCSASPTAAGQAGTRSDTPRPISPAGPPGHDRRPPSSARAARDGHVRPALTHRRHELPSFAGRLFKISVQEQQMPGAGRAVPSLKFSDRLRARHHCNRLTLAPPPADHQRTGFTGKAGCLIARCVVNDDHETAETSGRCHRRSDPELLISGRNVHGDVRAGGVRHGPEISSARHRTEIISVSDSKAVTCPDYDGGSPRYLNGHPAGTWCPRVRTNCARW